VMVTTTLCFNRELPLKGIGDSRVSCAVFLWFGISPSERAPGPFWSLGARPLSPLGIQKPWSTCFFHRGNIVKIPLFLEGNVRKHMVNIYIKHGQTSSTTIIKHRQKPLSTIIKNHGQQSLKTMVPNHQQSSKTMVNNHSTLWPRLWQSWHICLILAPLGRTLVDV
jgi:hypothetical protein